MHFGKIEGRLANGDILAGFVERIGVLYARVLLDFYGLSGREDDRFTGDDELLFTRYNIGVFIELWRLERFGPLGRRNHVRDGNLGIARCRDAVVFLDQFPVGGWDYERRVLYLIWFHYSLMIFWVFTPFWVWIFTK